ncbi:MAG TPA: DUF1697 domain-containing protein [Solirubrobacteraceae bacterium]|nr:DUF1697 domain-containing protein [Solirubrobacteraceae bacterium]
MARYAAFLRGMNVGGHRLTNDELRSHFRAMGFAEVTTFRASGNVMFADERPDDGAADPELLAGRIEERLAGALGYAVPTFIRSYAEVRAIAAHAPFAPERVACSTGKLQVSLLGSSPAPALREAVLSLASDEDPLAFGERELYWLPSGGMLDSALDLGAIEKLLGASTRRTKNTLEQIASRHCAD